MPRALAGVRPARPDDLDTLGELGHEARASVARPVPDATGVDMLAADRAELRARYQAALADPDVRVLVATDPERYGDKAVGMCLLTVEPANVLHTAAVHLSDVCVTARSRRRGVGRALVAAAAEYAEEVGYEAVAVTVTPDARETQRFYARLGFGPVVVRRVAPLGLLRRRLGRPAAPAAGARLAGRGPARVVELPSVRGRSMGWPRATGTES